MKRRAPLLVRVDGRRVDRRRVRAIWSSPPRMRFLGIEVWSVAERAWVRRSVAAISFGTRKRR